MANVKLLNFSASEINFLNEIKRSETFELTNRCSYNVRFAPNSFCRGEMTVEVFNKNAPDSFRFKLRVTGDFVIEDQSPQDAVHRATYKLLFPRVKAMVTSLTVAANLPPIFLPDLNIDDQSIYVVEKPNK